MLGPALGSMGKAESTSLVRWAGLVGERRDLVAAEQRNPFLLFFFLLIADPVSLNFELLFPGVSLAGGSVSVWGCMTMDVCQCFGLRAILCSRIGSLAR